MKTARPLLVALLTLAALPAAHASDVVLLGDESRAKVLATCKPCASPSLGVATPRRGATAHEVADVARDARHAVIVVDATSGPLPVVREHILVARQAGVPSLSIMFTNAAQLEGEVELLQLEELEIRELMNNYEMGGDDAMVFSDSAVESIGLDAGGAGMEAVLDAAKRLPARAAPALAAFNGKRFVVRLYLLSEQESADVVPLSNDSNVDLWIDGQARRARVQTDATLEPGADSELTLETEEPISSSLGARLLLERKGRLVAAGVLVR